MVMSTAHDLQSRGASDDKTEYMEMKMTIRRLYRSFKSRKGQGLVEYSFVLALVAIFAMVALRGVGSGVNITLTAINSNLP